MIRISYIFEACGDWGLCGRYLRKCPFLCRSIMHLSRQLTMQREPPHHWNEAFSEKEIIQLPKVSSRMRLLYNPKSMWVKNFLFLSFRSWAKWSDSVISYIFKIKLITHCMHKLEIEFTWRVADKKIRSMHEIDLHWPNSPVLPSPIRCFHTNHIYEVEKWRWWSDKKKILLYLAPAFLPRPSNIKCFRM